MVTDAPLVGLTAIAAAIALFESPPPARADVRTATEAALSSEAIDPAHVFARDLPPPPADEVLEHWVNAGTHWRLDTVRGAVHVWVPAGYDARTAATVVFVHGYWIDADEAWASYRLAQQFALSGINALFIVPEAPAAKWEAIAWPSLGELLRTVASRIDAAMPTRRLVAIGHSGAYRTLAVWLANPTLDTVVVLDAVYTEYGLVPWVRAAREHRLVNIAYETGRFSDELHRQLPSTRRVDGLPLDGLPDARILYVKTDVGHWPLVTDGVALPLALRALGVPRLPAPVDLPLGLHVRDVVCEPE